MLVLACGLILAGCASGGTFASPSTPGSPQLSPTASYDTESPGPQVIKVPSLVGLSLAEAKSRLQARSLSWTVKEKATSASSPGTILSASPSKGERVTAGTQIALVVAKAVPLPPTTQPPPPDCDPNYVGVCLKDGIGDFDCLGGSGNGPNYVAGPFDVVGGDPFGLDADGDGVGCE
jgi:PASTA domain-containing protein